MAIAGFSFIVHAWLSYYVFIPFYLIAYCSSCVPTTEFHNKDWLIDWICAQCVFIRAHHAKWIKIILLALGTTVFSDIMIDVDILGDDVCQLPMRIENNLRHDTASRCQKTTFVKKVRWAFFPWRRRYISTTLFIWLDLSCNAGALFSCVSCSSSSCQCCWAEQRRLYLVPADRSRWWLTRFSRTAVRTSAEYRE